MNGEPDAQIRRIEKTSDLAIGGSHNSWLLLLVRSSQADWIAEMLQPEPGRRTKVQTSTDCCG